MKPMRFHRVAAAAIAVALLSTACGSDSEQTDTQATSEQAEGATASDTGTASSTSQQASPPAARDFAAEDLEAILAESASLKDEDPTLSLLLAMEANRRSPDQRTEQAVLDVMGTSGVAVTPSLSVALPDASGCGLPLGSENGLHIFQVSSRRLIRNDLTTLEQVDHGPAPDPSPDDCGSWVGDVDTGSRVVSGTDGTWLLGSLDGESDVELNYGRRMEIASRTIVGNRVVFRAFDASGIAMVVFDATTGAVIAEVEGLAEPAEITTGGDGSQIGITTAVPGAGGQVIVLDAQTGEEIVRVDLVEASVDSRFDLDTGEVVAATVGGRLLTIDIATGEVVADVPTTNASPRGVNVGIRPDGLVVIATADMIEVVDRRSGPTGVMTSVDEVLFQRVQPNGLVMKVKLGTGTEIIDVDVHGLAGLPAEQWLEQACEVAGRDLTEAEWDELIPGNQPLQPLCA